MSSTYNFDTNVNFLLFNSHLVTWNLSILLCSSILWSVIVGGGSYNNIHIYIYIYIYIFYNNVYTYVMYLIKFRLLNKTKEPFLKLYFNKLPLICCTRQPTYFLAATEASGVALLNCIFVYESLFSNWTFLLSGEVHCNNI